MHGLLQAANQAGGGQGAPPMGGGTVLNPLPTPYAPNPTPPAAPQVVPTTGNTVDATWGGNQASAGMFRGQQPPTSNPSAYPSDPRFSTPLTMPPTFSGPNGPTPDARPADPNASQGTGLAVTGSSDDVAPPDAATGLYGIPISPADRDNLRIARQQGTGEVPGSVDPSVKHNQSGLSRFVHGMFRAYKNANPAEGGILGVLANTVGGGIASAASEKYDYQNQKDTATNKLFRQRAYDMGNEDFANKQITEQAKAANEYNQIGNRNLATQNTVVNEAATRALTKYKALDHYKRGENPALDAELAQGGAFPDKEKGDEFSETIAPNGNVVVFNKTQGTYKVGNESLAKPSDISEKDVNDSEFGVKSDKELEDMATAAVAPSVKSRQVRPEIASSAPAKYKNQDGSFNEQAWLKDVAQGNTDLHPSDVYQDLPTDDKQRVAQKMEQLRQAQQQTATEVAKFRSALNHRIPAQNATPVPLTQVKEWFKAANAPGKDRQTRLNTFYDLLAKQNIK